MDAFRAMKSVSNSLMDRAMTLAIYCICYMDNFDVLEAQRSHGRRKPDRIFDQAVKRSSCAEAESMPRPAVRHRPSHDPVGLHSMAILWKSSMRRSEVEY
jgi:hypothetical protein